MNLSYKYKLSPTKSQESLLEEIIYTCRMLYNAALEERISYYRKYLKSPSYGSQCEQLPEIRKSWDLKEKIHSQILQQVLKQNEIAFKRFFQGRKAGRDVGFPRFKGKFRSFSICFPQPDPLLVAKRGVNIIPTEHSKNVKLEIFGVGEVKMIQHRPLLGRCKQVRIKKEADGYYAIFSCEEVPKELLPKTGKEIGIDLGISNFITQDDGTTFHHPRSYKTSKEVLAEKNRKLTSKKRGSKNRAKALVALQRAHQKVSRVRNDFQHKLSKNLVKKYDRISIEKLNIESMLSNKGHTVKKENISDASWATFVALLKYKAANAGKEVVEVDPRNSSKQCYYCGNVKSDLTLHDRIYQCEPCGSHMDRDHNAAKNVKWRGSLLASGHSPRQKLSL